MQESGHGVELDSDASRKPYLSLAQAEFCHVTSCNRQGTPSGPVLLEGSLKETCAPGPRATARPDQSWN